MGFLAKMFGAVPADERRGIHLDSASARWKVSAAKDLPAFLRALADLAPPDSILYLEGGRPPAAMLAFLRERSVPEQSHVERGTIWPRPAVFHLPATRANLVALAEMAERCATAEVAIHLHLYREGRVLLQWYDAFFDPLRISKEVPDKRVQEFCEKLDLTCERDE